MKIEFEQRWIEPITAYYETGIGKNCTISSGQRWSRNMWLQPVHHGENITPVPGLITDIRKVIIGKKAISVGQYKAPHNFWVGFAFQEGFDCPAALVFQGTVQPAILRITSNMGI